MKFIKATNCKNIFKHYIYDTEPTKLTAQIEKITNYKIIPPLQKESGDLKDERKLVDSEVAVMIGSLNFKSDQFLCFYNS